MKKLLTLTAIIGIIALGFYFYFHNIGRVRANVNEIFISSVDVPESFNGARIVQISDLFVRSEQCLELLENVVSTINGLNPDIIIFTGNLLWQDGIAFANQVAELLSDLNANLMLIAVLGYYDLPNLELTSTILSTAEFKLLNNESQEVFYQSPIGINVIGAAPTNNRSEMEQLLADHILDNRFNILLMSVPTFSSIAFDHPIYAQFSGHCLATQDTTDPLNPCFQFYNGTYQFADRFTLNVSNGLARFHTLQGLFRQPSIDSFLLRIPPY